MPTNLFILNTPLQYLMARLIISNYHPRGSAIIQYRDEHDYSDAFARINEAVGTPTPQIFEYHPKIHRQFDRVERLFISDRFIPTQIFLSYKIRHDVLCGFEDGIGFYIPRHPTGYVDTDNILRLKNLIKLLIGLSGIRTHYQPSSFAFHRFQEIYSALPWVDHAAPSAKRYSLGDALSTLARPIDNGGLGTGLVLSQTTDGLADTSYYVTYLKSRIVELKKKHDVLYYKPHPRDPSCVTNEILDMGLVTILPEKYQNSPIELYIASYPKTEVYSFVSTALLYAHLFGAQGWSFGPSFKFTATPQRHGEVWEAVTPLLMLAGVKWYIPHKEEMQESPVVDR